MKITGVRIYPITLEFKQTIEESFGTVGKSEGDVILQIFTDEGISGLGESTTLGPFYSGESQGSVISSRRRPSGAAPISSVVGNHPSLYLKS